MLLRIVILGCLALFGASTLGYGQTRGRQMFLEGRDLLRNVTSFECRGEFLPGTPNVQIPWKVRMVFQGGAYRTEMTLLESPGGLTTYTRSFDGHTYQGGTKGDSENVVSSGITPPESHHYQVPSPFDLAYGWTKQPFSEFKADSKLWATAEQMVDVADETINHVRCLKTSIHRESDGVTISKWLSYDHLGMPVKSLATNSSGTVLKRVDVLEFMTIDVGGVPLLFPLHIQGKLTYPYELKIDRDSVRVNEPIPASEFEVSTANVEELYDRDTGVLTDLRTGRVFDRNMNEIFATPTQPVAQVPEKPVRVWLILLNTAMAIALGLFLLRNRLWARKNPD